jgi:hypothetical protein
LYYPFGFFLVEISGFRTVRGGVVNRDDSPYVQFAIGLAESVGDGELIVYLVGGVAVQDYACGFGNQDVQDRSMIPRTVRHVFLKRCLHNSTYKEPSNRLY